MEHTQHSSKAERILVALDGSAPSNRALDKAISLAERCQGKIYLIRILEMEAQDGDGREGQNRLVEDMQAKLGHIREEVEKHGLECEFAVHVGPQIASLIVQEAKDKDIDIIAMGTHGWTGQTAIVAMGSVARKVLCSSPCPVLIIPPHSLSGTSADCHKK